MIGEADLAPCGGTHLRDTFEVGGVRALPEKPLPTGGSRLSFELADDPSGAERGGAPPTPAG